ncbi:MAG: type II toxin-antitoxin system HicB family antitoxin [Acidobacteriota bacterium]|nr:type II toxin-antitoxin system HicB family antitoxin [Acidobacteriota bacterium]
MTQTLHHRGYDGSVLYSAEDKLLYGRLLGIRDSITYEGNGVRSLEKNFKEAVDEYIADCESDGRKPNTPYKGSFNVRVAVELHQRAARFAEQNELALNTVVQKALSTFLNNAEDQPCPKPKLSTARSAAKPSRSTRPTSRSARTAAA